ncbi:hypothetical protein ANAPH2_00106 [Anaplasma phagocytophilum]|nr:hypothetical protein ANAPH2_00106 [Anaplasma phagocytophilum]
MAVYMSKFRQQPFSVLHHVGVAAFDTLDTVLYSELLQICVWYSLAYTQMLIHSSIIMGRITSSYKTYLLSDYIISC